MPAVASAVAAGSSRRKQQPGGRSAAAGKQTQTQQLPSRTSSRRASRAGLVAAMADSTASKADPDKSGKPASSGSIGRSNGNDVDPKSDQPAKSADGAEGKQRKNSASTQDDQNLLKYANVGTLSDVVAAAASASEAAMEASTSTSKPVLGKRELALIPLIRYVGIY